MYHVKIKKAGIRFDVRHNLFQLCFCRSPVRGMPVVDCNPSYLFSVNIRLYFFYILALVDGKIKV